MRQGRVLGLVACGLAVALVASCSDETKSGGTTGSGGTGGTASSSGTGGSTSSGGDGGSAGGGGATSSSGTGGSSSTSGTAGGGGVAGGGGSGGNGGSPIVVDCGGNTCTPTEVCCWMTQSLTCVDSGQCYGMPLGCDDPGDCVAPELCCHKQAQFLCASGCGSGSGQGNIVCANDQDCISPAPHCCPNVLGQALPKTCTHIACP